MLSIKREILFHPCSTKGHTLSGTNNRLVTMIGSHADSAYCCIRAGASTIHTELAVCVCV